MLNSPELTYKITNFANQQFCTDEKSLNMAVQEVNNIFYKAAKKAELRKKKGVTIKKQKHANGLTQNVKKWGKNWDICQTESNADLRMQ